jgi:thermitase
MPILALCALLAITVALAEAIDLDQTVEPQVVPECVAGELLVKFRPGADPAAVAARHGGTISSQIAAIAVYVVSVPDGTVEQKVAEFNADPEVEYAEPNHKVRAADPADGAASCEPAQ